MRKVGRLGVFKNRVLRMLFGPQRNEITGEWRKLHNEELNDMYSSPNIIWVIKTIIMMGGAWGTYGVEVHTGF